jgi:hypothetical protein
LSVEEGDAEDGEQDLANTGFKFKGGPVKPVINLGRFEGGRSVKGFVFSGQKSQDSVGSVKGSFWSGKNGNFGSQSGHFGVGEGVRHINMFNGFVSKGGGGKDFVGSEVS